MLPSCDIHFHLYRHAGIPALRDLADTLGYKHYAALSIGGYPIDGADCTGAGNLNVLALKKHDLRCFAFAGPDSPDRGAFSAEHLLEQVRLYHEAGFDGLKMMEGKPNYRVQTGYPLNSARYRPMLDFCEENGMPVLMHVNDPRAFWDPAKCSPGARAMGWLAPKGAPSFDEVAAEALGVCEDHPGLRVTFSHMFFAEDQGDGPEDSAEKFSAMLDSHPNMNVDLAPGMMVEAFAAAPEVWRPVLMKYADRILFGTDNYDLSDPVHARTVWRFYATEDPFEYRGKTIRGIRLDDDALTAIGHDNFLRFTGETRRDIDPSAVSRLAEAALDHIRGSANEVRWAESVRIAQTDLRG